MPFPAKHVQKGLSYLTNHFWLVSARATSTASSPKTPRPFRTSQDLPKSPQDLSKTSLRPLGSPLSPKTFQGPPKVPEKNPKARLARTEGTATLYKSFLCYSVHTRTRVFCRALKWEHPCSISMRPKNKGCPSVWVAVLGPIWTSLVPNVVIQRLVFCCQVFF